MPQNLLTNGDFEADWGEEESHRCLVFPNQGGPQEKDIGNIFTPPGWLTWFRHDPGTWDQPEVRDAWAQHDPQRVHEKEKAILLFTFFRKHDGGFLQQVQVAPGTSLRLTAWTHAWSNWHDGPHPDDPRWSEGPGYDAGFILEGDTQGNEWRNFTFTVGIDPTGGTDPEADTVVWGRGAHVYNVYAQLPSAEAEAQADTVTVFLRSKTLWPYKHNDAYWDAVELVAVDGEVPPEVRLSHEPATPQVGKAVTVEARSQSALTDVDLVVRGPSGAQVERGSIAVGRDGDWNTWTATTATLAEKGIHEVVFTAAGDVKETATFEASASTEPLPPGRGQPRVQYERTYVLLPPGAGEAWALAVVDGTWDRRRYTVGSSADDAGIGDLDVRRVIAVNPGGWPGNLRSFFEEFYRGVEYTAVEADTPEELRRKLEEM
jgi:hypothetical protein